MEVDVAHPGFHVSRLGFHRHEAAVHESHHVANGVHRRHFLLYLPVIVVKHLHGVGQVQVIRDGVLVAVVFLREVFVDGLPLGNVLDEVLDLDVPLVLPGVGASPVLVEGLLYFLHLLVGSLLGIFLHTGVDGGIDLQAFGIEGVAIVEVFLAPAFQIVGHSLAKVVGIAVVGRLHTVVKFDVELLERVTLFSGQVTVLMHEVEDDVTALEGVLGIDEGIIIGCSF